jgi:hypothetical protein
VRSCGCLRSYDRALAKKKSYSSEYKIGQKFNAFTVTGCVEPSNGNNGGGVWTCVCDCGKTMARTGRQLIYGKGHRGCTRPDLYRRSNADDKRQLTISNQYTQHKKRCKLKGIEHLDFTDWESVVFRPCHYCGLIDERSYTNKYIQSYGEEIINLYKVKINGVDRLDSSIGYTLSNCVPCCFFCNTAKYAHEENYFLSRIKQIYEFRRLGEFTPTAP